MVKKRLLDLARKYLPATTRRRLTRLTRWPMVGWVYFGSFRRLRPISAEWGMERGQPIDRYYIDRFLGRQASDIHGRVLEIGENRYTRRYGGENVTESVVLHVAEQKEQVTIIDDLTQGEQIPSDAFDCAIVTQTLQAIYDVPAAVATIYRLLKPGGVALVTVPGISKISRYDMDRWGYYWSFTTSSMARLFGDHFPAANVTIEAGGNVLTSIAFLHGLALEELTTRQLEAVDPDYQMLITVRAVKPAASGEGAPPNG